MCNMPYHKAVGALNWAMLAMYPDIEFTVTIVAHFTSNPGPAHWEAINWIFHYLSGTQDLWLTYGKDSSPLEGYADVDSSMAKDCHTISGYTCLIDSSAISWSSKQ